jgi:hypothetical protein
MTTTQHDAVALLGACLTLAVPLCADCPPEPGRLSLDLPPTQELCLTPGESLAVTLYMSCLDVPVSGYQVFLEFDTAALQFVSGEYILPEPFGLPLVWPIQAEGGYVDFAAGINVMGGQLPTQADAPLAHLTFAALATTSVTSVRFRPHAPPTQLSTADGQPLLPALVDTPPLQVSPACALHLGDLDCDGDVDFDDINPFVLALSDPVGYGALYPNCQVLNGDCNQDGQVDFDDINAFVALLSGG